MGTLVIQVPAFGDYRWRDPVANQAALPSSGNNVSDVRLSVADNAFFVWSGSAWVAMSVTSFSPGGTTAQYVRGDGSLATNNVAALVAVTDASSAASGAVGEFVTGSQVASTSTGVGLTGVWGSVTSISLTAGDWKVWGTVAFVQNGAQLTTSLACACSLTSNAVASEFDSTVYTGITGTTTDVLLPTPVFRVNVSSTTTVYLLSQFNYTSGSPQHRGRIQARRVR